MRGIARLALSLALALGLALENAQALAAAAAAVADTAGSDPRAGKSSPAWYPQGGARYATSHATKTPIPGQDHFAETFDVETILEFHFHAYFFEHNPQAKADAMRLRRELIDAVARGDFVCVLPGVTAAMIPGLNESEIWPIDDGPIGPHPVGQYEIWVPDEHLAAVMSFIMIHRGEVSILFHPLTHSCIEDHSGRAMWLGPPFRLDLTPLTRGTDHCDRPQYRSLGLGYAKRHVAEAALIS